MKSMVNLKREEMHLLFWVLRPPNNIKVESSIVKFKTACKDLNFDF